MSKFINPVEIKLSREDLCRILTEYLNSSVFRDHHQVEALSLHPNSDHVVTMVVGPEEGKTETGDED